VIICTLDDTHNIVNMWYDPDNYGTGYIDGTKSVFFVFFFFTMQKLQTVQNRIKNGIIGMNSDGNAE